MSLHVKVSRDSALEAGEVARLLDRCENLPFSHLPAVRRETAVAATLETLLRAGNAAENDVITLEVGGRLEGLAVLQPSPWDAKVLNRRAGRVSAVYVASDASFISAQEVLLQEVAACVAARGYDFVDMSLPVAATAQIDAACAAGWRFVAVNMGIVWDLHRPRQRATNPATRLSMAGPADTDRLVALASRAIDHHSRFAADPRFAPDLAPRVFGAWARSLAEGRAALIHLCWHGEELAGYCAWRLNAALEAHGGPRVAVLELTSVAPELRQQGVMGALVHGGLQHFQAEGVSIGEVYTHVLNGGMQRACILAGGMTRTARVTLHWHRPV